MSNLPKLKKRIETLDDDEKPSEQKLPSSAMPSPESLPTNVYETGVDDLSRLDADTASDVISFYSSILEHKTNIRDIREDRSLPMAAHKDLCEDIEELCVDRENLLEVLET